MKSGRAIVTVSAGEPGEVLKYVEDHAFADPKEGWVGLEVKACGLNRSELFTRQGHSPSVVFPRVQGIECVGVVDCAPGEPELEGAVVAAIMDGMGRDFDGGYAEYATVPRGCVHRVPKDVFNGDWRLLGATPEMFQTAHGSLYAALGIKRGQSLCIRGGTSSVGLTAAYLAHRAGLRVVSTTRSETKADKLRAFEYIDDAVMDAGKLADTLVEKFDCVLELIGTTTLRDSLQMCQTGGVVCMTGILGGEWTMQSFTPMEEIPTGVKLTTYGGGSEDLDDDDYAEYLRGVFHGSIPIQLDEIFKLEDLPRAHERMERNEAIGKVVCVM